MMCIRISLVTACLAIASWGSAWGASQASSPLPERAAPVEEQLAELNRSVKELSGLLREYLARQEVGLMLKRVEISLQKIGPAHQELNEMRTRKAADEEELGQLRNAIAARKALESSEAAASQDPQEVARTAQLELDIKALRSRISGIDLRIQELEGELAEERRMIQYWEAAIDKLLRLR